MDKTAERPVGADGKRRSPPTERVIAVIELLGQSSESLSLTQMIKATSTTPPTLLAILRSLVDANWVVRNEQDLKYRLGPALHRVTSRHDDWAATAEEICGNLGAELGYECSVATLSGSDMTLLYDWLPADVHHPSLQNVKMPFAAPLGAALAAVLPDAEQSDWLERGKQSNPNQDTQRLKGVLAGIRERGFNIHHAQHDDNRFLHTLISGSSNLHYPTVRTLLAMTEQALAPEQFTQLGSLAIGTISAAHFARSPTPAVSVSISCAGDVLPRQLCLDIGAKVRDAVTQISEAIH